MSSVNLCEITYHHPKTFVPLGVLSLNRHRIWENVYFIHYNMVKLIQFHAKPALLALQGHWWSSCRVSSPWYPQLPTSLREGQKEGHDTYFEPASPQRRPRHLSQTSFSLGPDETVRCGLCQDGSHEMSDLRGPIDVTVLALDSAYLKSHGNVRYRSVQNSWTLKETWEVGSECKTIWSTLMKGALEVENRLSLKWWCLFHVLLHSTGEKVKQRPSKTVIQAAFGLELPSQIAGTWHIACIQNINLEKCPCCSTRKVPTFSAR